MLSWWLSTILIIAIIAAVSEFKLMKKECEINEANRLIHDKNEFIKDMTNSALDVLEDQVVLMHILEDIYTQEELEKLFDEKKEQLHEGSDDFVDDYISINKGFLRDGGKDDDEQGNEQD